MYSRERSTKLTIRPRVYGLWSLQLPPFLSLSPRCNVEGENESVVCDDKGREKGFMYGSKYSSQNHEPTRLSKTEICGCPGENEVLV